MIVYLASDSRNTFFTGVVRAATDEYRPSMPNGTRLDLIYPPERLGVDKGSVLANVLEIRGADVVLFDVTPITTPDSNESYNPGVMVEFGIVTALENPLLPVLPWNNKFPKPVYRVFRDSRFQRRNASALLNHVEIIPYTADEPGRDPLRRTIIDILVKRVAQRVEYSYVAGQVSGITTY